MVRDWRRKQKEERNEKGELKETPEQGIARDMLHGSVLAWKFLAAHGVPDDTIVRVLAHPAERRGSDAAGARLMTGERS